MELLALLILWTAVIMAVVAIFFDQYAERRRSQDTLLEIAAEHRRLAARKARVEAEMRRALAQRQFFDDHDDRWREAA